jgi:hypothetical protein
VTAHSYDRRKVELCDRAHPASHPISLARLKDAHPVSHSECFLSRTRIAIVQAGRRHVS